MINRQVGKRHKAFKFSWANIKVHCICFFIFFFGLIYFISVGVHQFKLVNYFPIKEVKVAGIQHVTHQEMQRLLKPLVSRGFFAANVAHIKESILQFPWVADVSVRRIWPNQIAVQVTEKNPLARWNETKLLTVSGQIFNPPKATWPSDLPEFIASEGEQLKLVHYYEQMNTVLTPLRIKITRVELTPGQTWKLVLDNGIKLRVGHKDVLTRVSDFVKVYPKIIQDREGDVDYIDLRYVNGLAVHWKK
jgi:cell division protein FtsQ